MADLPIGTLVMVIRTGTGLDGATGTIEGSLAWRFGVDVRTNATGAEWNYAVRMARLTPWGEVLGFAPGYLVPLSPPGPETERDVPAELPAHALV